LHMAIAGRWGAPIWANCFVFALIQCMTCRAVSAPSPQVHEKPPVHKLARKLHAIRPVAAHAAADLFLLPTEAIMSADSILKQIADEHIEFIDLRFTDLLGKQHHLTYPAHSVDESLFEDGKMFDGSSITGWKGISESDMVLMPDPDTAFVDPFSAHKQLVMTCDVLEPSTMQAYGRDPRSIARRGEAYLKTSGIADTAFFGPEPEFFVFDSIRWRNDMGRVFYEIESEEAAWSSS